MTEFRARVTHKRPLADGIVELEIQRGDGAQLPPWWPGAHVDLLLENGLTRQYSIVGAGSAPDSFRVAVLNEPDGRGGSLHIHESVGGGSKFVVGGWRNNFPLLEAEEYIFIAGGIGVTAMLPMALEAERRGVKWTLLYAGRTRSGMAYLSDVARFGPAVQIFVGEDGERLDVDALLDQPREGTLVYCCGPERLIDGVQKAMNSWPEDAFHSERFTPRTRVGGEEAELTSFDVELRRTGLTVTVRPNLSIVDACEEAGVSIPTSCREGTCGSCETLVVEGRPSHRDSVLNAMEAGSDEVIIPCVSRSCSPNLVLDL